MDTLATSTSYLADIVTTSSSHLLVASHSVSEQAFSFAAPPPSTTDDSKDPSPPQPSQADFFQIGTDGLTLDCFLPFDLTLLLFFLLSISFNLFLSFPSGSKAAELFDSVTSRFGDGKEFQASSEEVRTLLSPALIELLTRLLHRPHPSRVCTTRKRSLYILTNIWDPRICWR